MAAATGVQRARLASVALRPLEERDAAQAAEIERDAFPTLFPPTSFRRALRNRNAGYLGAALDDDGGETWPQVSAGGVRDEGRPLLSKLVGGARSVWPGPRDRSPGQRFLIGFVGTLYVVDEAHIVSVGVRTEYRGRGIGELLLIGAVARAIDVGMSSTTLEVRVSNRAARGLYRKYGLTQRGLRKGYYSDDREDAAIMTADAIGLPPYRERFRRLVEGHQARWGYDVPECP